jgi:hypothetical protein
MIEDHMRAHDEQFSQISIAHFRDTAQSLLATGRVLSRRQAKKGGELARASESGDVLNAGDHRRGRPRAQAGNGHQSARQFVVSSHRSDGSIAARDFLIQNMQLPHQWGERRAHAGWNRLVALTRSLILRLLWVRAFLGFGLRSSNDRRATQSDGVMAGATPKPQPERTLGRLKSRMAGICHLHGIRNFRGTTSRMVVER